MRLSSPAVRLSVACVFLFGCLTAVPQLALAAPKALADGVSAGPASIPRPPGVSFSYWYNLADGDRFVLNRPRTAPGDDAHSDVYERQGLGWTLADTFSSLPSIPASEFGRVAALSGDTMLGYGGARRVVVYRRSGGAWEPAVELGNAATRSGGILTAGLYGDTAILAEESRLEVFGREDSGWTQEATIPVPAGGSIMAAAMERDRLVAAVSTSASSAEGVYVFGRTGAGWIQQAFLPGNHDSVALCGDTIAAGAWTFFGVQVWRCESDEWLRVAELVPLGSLTAYGSFGQAVALSSDRLWVGAPNTSDITRQAGAVYEFTRVGTDWLQTSRYDPPDPADSGKFGISLAQQGGALLVGTATGAAYAIAEPYRTEEDVAYVRLAPGILGNDIAAEPTSLTAEIVVQPEHGQVELATDGAFTYTPDPDFNGVDAFAYSAHEGTAVSEPATVTIEVRAVNDAPVAEGDFLTCAHATTLVIAAERLLLNDSDVDGDRLEIRPIALPEHGSLATDTGGSMVYVPESSFAGTDHFSYRAFDGTAWSDPATVTISVESPIPTAYREVSGPNRYATAAAISHQAFPSGVTTVVVATGRNWPDALAAGALAGALDAPVILSDRDSLPASSSAEIARLGARDAVIIGGEASVGEAVRSALDESLTGAVTRIAGRDRYETASAVASAAIAVLGEAFDGKVFVAKGTDFPDALAASPLSAGCGWPVYLASPKAVPECLMSALREQDVRSVLILGDDLSVTPSVESSCVSEFGVDSVRRLQGGDRYQTAVEVASYALIPVGFSVNEPAIATGSNYPDALTGGVSQGRLGRLLLLTPPTFLHPSTQGFLREHMDGIRGVTYLGSPSAVSLEVREAVAETLH